MKKVIVVLVCVLCIVAGIGLWNVLGKLKGGNEIEPEPVSNAVNTVEEEEIETEPAEEEEEEEEEEAEEEEPQRRRSVDLSLRKKNTIDFKELWEQNEDIFAWLEVPGTLVDYPVLQHPTDDEYYLNHTVNHVAGLPGSIYSESIHPTDMSAEFSVFYGHNMRNDTMFGSLHDFEDVDFFEEYPYVYLYLPDRTMIYEIFASVSFTNDYLPYYFERYAEEDIEKFIEDLKDRAICLDVNFEIYPEDRFLLLSTCAGDHSIRYLVATVLIDEYKNAYVMG